ncbi:hypothetical protein J4405_00265 [Candidatus Woesearchaeota archaeon]|nr:hypothetical protein [Candidatus Woesearchaeota archaeon]
MRTKVKKAVNETGEFLKFVLKVLQVRYFAVAFSIIFFVLIYFITPYYWSHGVSILIAYMVADLIRIIIIDGNNRFIQFNSLMFSRERNERRHKGHAYLIFLFYIMMSTIASAFFADWLLEQITGVNKFFFLFAVTIIVLVLVYLDFHFSYYDS